jgi:hypothetical protein
MRLVGAENVLVRISYSLFLLPTSRALASEEDGSFSMESAIAGTLKGPVLSVEDQLKKEVLESKRVDWTVSQE